MSDRRKREKNRRTAQWLRHQRPCVECGERGLHWVSFPMTLKDILNGDPDTGFWTCKKFYGPDGRRIAP